METQSNGDKAYSGFPQWTKVVMQVGFPIFVALWFMGVFEKFIPNVWALHVSASEIHYNEMSSLPGKIDQQNRLLRLICRNGAPDIATKLECDR